MSAAASPVGPGSRLTASPMASSKSMGLIRTGFCAGSKAELPLSVHFEAAGGTKRRFETLVIHPGPSIGMSQGEPVFRFR